MPSPRGRRAFRLSSRRHWRARRASRPSPPARRVEGQEERGLRLLVIGGAGYVGSTSVERFLEAGHHVVVYDNLSTGHAGAVPDGARLEVGDIADRARLERLLREGVDAVLHCAARSVVAESMDDPGLYYRTNVGGGVTLLEAMKRTGVTRLVFSSTSAVYGEPR